MHRDYGGVGSRPGRRKERTLRNLTYTALVLVLLPVFAHVAPGASKTPANLKLTRDDLTLHITLENDQKLKVTSKGTRLKAGTYWVKSVQVFKKDEKGGVWELRTVEALGGMKTITVAAGQEKIIDCGPPLSIHMWARQGDGAQSNTVAIDLSVVGKYNERYWPGAWRGRKGPPAPGLKIVLEDGTVIHRARFPVAANGRCRYTWRVPSGFKGKYRVEPVLTFGPYKWKSNREGHFFEIK